MEIKSIKKISQVGVFSNCQEGSKRFEKLTLLYGFNTHGKSTLCDILNSLSMNDPKIIESRRTIPKINSPQSIEISYQDELGEKSVYFRNKAWEENSLGKRVEVFGTDFIHNNVFTGLSIARQNKENFTDFILGERGVLLAKQLEQTNHELRTANLAFGKSSPTYVSGKTTKEINNFIDLVVEESKEMIFDKIQIKTANMVAEKEKLDNFDKILKKSVPKVMLDSELKKIIVLFRYANYCLRLDYEKINNLVMEKLKHHISKNFSDTKSAESWIQKGLLIGKINENSNCPFCGQQLINALDLLNCYKEYYNEEYKKFITNIDTALEKSINKLEKINLNLTRTLLENLLVISEYDLLITNKKFKNSVESLEQFKSSLTNLEQNLHDRIREAILNLKSKITLKRETPHQCIEGVDVKILKELILKSIKNYDEARFLNNDIVTKIEDFKSQFSTEQIKRNINAIQLELEDLNKKKARLEQDAQCRNYRTLENDILKLKEETKRLSKELEDTQSEYIDKYFIQIDRLFAQLGSSDFRLEKHIDTRGNKKVYSLSVKYKNQKITNEQLPYVFSESDRRALALSIFWTKLNTIEEKTKTIVVLDDPAASFDDNRITKTINLFKTTIDDLGQIIILTHYQHFVTRFLEITKDKQIPFKIFQVCKTSNNCELREVKRQDFLLDNHEKKFMEIYNFINRVNDTDVRNELRPYLENYLKRVFFKQILDYSIDTNNLENFINILHCENVIDETHVKELHKYRRTLNPDSHIFTCNNIEDLRNFTLEMITFLHNLSFQ